MRESLLRHDYGALPGILLALLSNEVRQQQRAPLLQAFGVIDPLMLCAPTSSPQRSLTPQQSECSASRVHDASHTLRWLDRVIGRLYGATTSRFCTDAQYSG